MIHRSTPAAAVAWSLVAVAAVATLVLFRALPYRADEWTHALIVEGLMRGERMPQFQALTTFATYHRLLAEVASWVGEPGRITLRAVTFVASVTIAASTAWLLHATRPQWSAASRALRVAQVLMLPLLFPFLFVVYTDAVAASLVVAGLAAWFTGYRVMPAALLLAAVAIRQQNIVFAGALIVLHVAAGDWRIGAMLARLRDAAALLVLCTLFVVFVAVNGGVALGDAASHPLGVYGGNLWIGALAGGWLFLPVAIARRAEIVALVRRRPWLALLALALAAVFVAWFAAPHPYNTGMVFFLRNILIGWLQQSWTHRALLAPLIVVFVLLLPVLLRRRDGRAAADVAWLFGIGFGATAMSLLIEQRYLIPAFVLLTAMRAADDARTELNLFYWWTAHTLALVWFIAIGAGFL